ncbi:MAG: hypothetical protein KH208_04605, partial [Desulfovibrio sp.]|uniref:hypothetical protein n=1 Tax=Desulfovibrio sp. TaxID=885 RepID=UPI0025C2FB01
MLFLLRRRMKTGFGPAARKERSKYSANARQATRHGPRAAKGRAAGTARDKLPTGRKEEKKPR